MYYPVLRGKQFELIGLRGLSEVLDKKQWCPIITPVRKKLQPLVKTIESLNQNDICPIIIDNPYLGDFSCESNLSIEELLKEFDSELKFIPCFTTKNINLDQIKNFCNKHQNEYAIFIEDGVSKELIEVIEQAPLVIAKKYQQKAFRNFSKVVIVEDNFKVAKTNALYPDKSFFSDKHTDYKKDNIVGYGDYTITGSDFIESGGPAYVVAIHLSYIDPNEFDAMYIRHFKSYNDSSPTKPGAKFGDALNQMISFCNDNHELVYETIGVKSFKDLKSREHFPGLGQIKKYSIQHHIQTLCMYGEKHD